MLFVIRAGEFFLRCFIRHPNRAQLTQYVRFPVTNAGKMAYQFAKDFFDASHDGRCKGDVMVTLEFDGDEDEDICFKKYRDNYGRLLAYVHRPAPVSGDNWAMTCFNIALIRDGWSSYFVKVTTRIHASSETGSDTS